MILISSLSLSTLIITYRSESGESGYCIHFNLSPQRCLTSPSSRSKTRPTGHHHPLKDPSLLKRTKHRSSSSISNLPFPISTSSHKMYPVLRTPPIDPNQSTIKGTIPYPLTSSPSKHYVVPGLAYEYGSLPSCLLPPQQFTILSTTKNGYKQQFSSGTPQDSRYR